LHLVLIVAPYQHGRYQYRLCPTEKMPCTEKDFQQFPLDFVKSEHKLVHHMLANYSFGLLANYSFVLLANYSFVLLANYSFGLLANYSFVLLANYSFVLLAPSFIRRVGGPALCRSVWSGMS
jgi:hypothetical protein